MEIPTEVIKIITQFQREGQKIYIVGGAVRDLLTQKQVNDWDFATSATSAQILKILPGSFYNNRFGTVSLKTKLGTFEITTFRKEGEYLDFRHPKQIVWGQTIEEDLARRDFTINAIAIALEQDRQGEWQTHLIDPFDGQTDLKNQIIKAVGNPKIRFQEDALRLLRAVRIAAQLKFSIDTDTLAAIKANSHLIANISGERIRDELFKILATDKPADAFWLLKNTNLLKYILPELEECFKVDQKSPYRHHIYDVGTHCLKSLEFCPSKDPLVRFAALIHDIGKPAVVGKGPRGETTFYNHEVVGAHLAKEISLRLHLSKKMRDKLVTLVRWHQFTVDESTTPAAVRRFIKRVGVENVKDMLDVRIGDRLGGGLKEATSWRLRRFMKMVEQELNPPFSVTDLAVNGHDVMRILEIKPGPKVGQVLHQLFEEVVEDRSKNNKEYLINRLHQMKKTFSAS